MKKLVYCFRCGALLEKETDKYLKRTYPYVCPRCDENMFSFEAVSSDEFLARQLPLSTDFEKIFEDKTLNHYEIKDSYNRILVWDDEELFKNEPEYENEVSRGSFKHSSIDKTLYFIIDDIFS